MKFRNTKEPPIKEMTPQVQCSEFEALLSRYWPHGGQNVHFVRTATLLGIAVLMQGCVTAGYEGQVGNMVSGDQISSRREAMKTVQVAETAPAGYRKLKQVTVRRCHRSLTEDAPKPESLTEDLKLAAYAEGGELVTGITTQTKNGLAANCWYVLEATGDVWTKGN